MEGRYIYCVTDGGNGVTFGMVGIEGSEVYSVPFKDTCAVVQNCAGAYLSSDKDTIVKWVVTHQQVVNEAVTRFGTVLPIRFDTIIKGGPDVLKGWLEDNYDILRQKIERFKGKSEYGLQVFWNRSAAAERLMGISEDIISLKRKMKSKPAGSAYMYRQIHEKVLRREIGAEAESYFNEIYKKIKERADEINVERIKKTSGEMEMVMSVSFLTSEDRLSHLLGELEETAKSNGLSTSITGPWPPYTFAGVPN